MDNKFKTNKDRFEQLELCKYKDKLGHSLENNVAFIALKKDSYSLEDLKELADECYRGRWTTGKDQFIGLWTFLEFLETGQTEISKEESSHKVGYKNKNE